MLPPITIARSLPVCPTLAIAVFVMRVCLPLFLSLQSILQFATNRLHNRETKHPHRWLIPEMRVKNFFLARKDLEYFLALSIVALKFFTATTYYTSELAL